MIKEIFSKTESQQIDAILESNNFENISELLEKVLKISAQRELAFEVIQKTTNELALLVLVTTSNLLKK
jgi:hypothetical protein